MNRMAVGLAVGAGYVLGRTKKAKFAFAVGTMVAGKRLNLSPKALGAFVNQQLQNNPQFKEIGDQLRQDVRGVGKAATGSLLNRQLEGLADRLHDRTLGVQDRISGVVPGQADDADEGRDQDEDAEDRDTDRSEARDEDEESERSGRRKKAPSKRTARKPDAKSDEKPDGKSAPKSAKSAAKKTPAKKSPQDNTRKTAQKKSTAAARGTARRAASSASSARSGGGRAKGGSDHG
ncbi:DNA primase [Streptomyces sp. NPDC029674]|uniref:DNA primase n=1 Tax=Streptomyces sp. NPDC029674 TaxID=3365297 RepID=UPI00384DB65E